MAVLVCCGVLPAGLIPPSAGHVEIEGLNVPDDMLQIYQRIGVCPQHDLLWGLLTGREHLRFYGTLKGLHGQLKCPAVLTWMDHSASHETCASLVSNEAQVCCC